MDLGCINKTPDFILVLVAVRCDLYQRISIFFAYTMVKMGVSSRGEIAIDCHWRDHYFQLC